MTTHWQRWHEPYDDPSSSLSRRLDAVQREIVATLDDAPEGPLRIFSVCAGQGRDLLDVLATHPRRADTHPLLVELDPACATAARERANRLGVSCEVREADAAETALYDEHRPAWLAVVCGVFGNISDEDVEITIKSLAAMVSVGGSVIWSRHRLPPNLVPQIRRWFEQAGFREAALIDVADSSATVARHVLEVASTDPPPPRLFRFVGDGSGALG